MPARRSFASLDRISGPSAFSPQARSAIRLALVACWVVTVAALLVVVAHARAAESAFEEAVASTRPENSRPEHTVPGSPAGGATLETALRPGGQPAEPLAAALRAQRWWTSALLLLTVMLAAISIVATFSERAAARARRAEAMQQLALGLRHELNNALASVLLNAELVAEARGLDDSGRERIAAITEQAERMRDVLRRLEHRERLDVIVPYLGDGFMVDLSAREGDPLTNEARRDK
jgi:signal transduction histidine kinase